MVAVGKVLWCQVMLDIYVLVLTAACYVSVCKNVVHEARVSVGCIVYVELSVPPLVQYPPVLPSWVDCPSSCVFVDRQSVC